MGCSWICCECGRHAEGEAPSNVLVRRTRRVSSCADAAERVRRGFFYGWVVWAVACMGQMITFAGTSAGVTFIVDDLIVELGLKRATVSLAYTIGTLFGAAVQPPIGRAVDRFGGRVSISVCSAAFSLSLCTLALPRSWLALVVAFGALRALGFGGLSLACTTCMQQWFIARRGLASGLLEAVSSFLGFGCYSALLVALIAAHGWRYAYTSIGLAQLALYTPIAALLLRDRPEDIGLLPDGVRAPPSQPSDGGKSHKVEGWTLAEARRTLCFWLLAASNGLTWGSGAGLFFHLASLTSDLGLEPAALALYIYLPWATTRAASLVLAGWLLDRVPPRLVLMAGSAFGGVAYGILGFPDVRLTPPLALVFAVVFGAGMGGSMAVFRVAPAKFFGRRHLGFIQGALQATNVAATAVGPLLLGAVRDATGSYIAALRGLAIALLAFACLSTFLAPPRVASAHGTRSTAPAQTAKAPETELPSVAVRVPQPDGEHPPASSSEAAACEDAKPIT